MSEDMDKLRELDRVKGFDEQLLSKDLDKFDKFCTSFDFENVDVKVSKLVNLDDERGNSAIALSE